MKGQSVKVLVTGGSGFIGSHLVRELLRQGCSVRVLDNWATGRPENLDEVREEIDLRRGSVADVETARSAVDGCEVVFHLAAVPSVARSLKDPVSTNEANVTGTITMLAAARDGGARRFVYAGSSSVYGSNPALPKREDMHTAPKSPYAVAKLAGEQYTRVFGQLFELETVCLRYFNVFGPRQDPGSKYAGVIPAFILALLEGRPLRLEGDGTQSRDFTYVANVVQANLLAMRAPASVSGEVFNIGCGQRFDINYLIEQLGGILNVEPQVERLPGRPGDVPHSLADVSLAQRLLGYAPAVSFPEGLRQTVAWYQQQTPAAITAR